VLSNLGVVFVLVLSYFVSLLSCTVLTLSYLVLVFLVFILPLSCGVLEVVFRLFCDNIVLSHLVSSCYCDVLSDLVLSCLVLNRKRSFKAPLSVLLTWTGEEKRKGGIKRGDIGKGRQDKGQDKAG
jgi:hypothetical protein